MPKRISPLSRAALAGGLVLFLCTGCGDESQDATSPLGVDAGAGAGQFTHAPGSRVTAIPAPGPRDSAAVDHGTPQNFWPNPGWKVPRPQPNPRRQENPRVTADGGQATSGPFGLPGDIPSPQPNPRRQEVAAAPAATGTLLKEGEASWYGPGFHGRKTANGETYDQRAMTAAMTGVPLGIRVRVERVDTGKSIEVRVNDRGPYDPFKKHNAWKPHATRVIDLSERAMEELGGIQAGVIDVKVYRLD